MFNEALVEVAQKYVKKGSHLYVAGQLETRSYEKDDEKRYVTEVVLRPFNGDIKLLDKKPKPLIALGFDFASLFACWRHTDLASMHQSG